MSTAAFQALAMIYSQHSSKFKGKTGRKAAKRRRFHATRTHLPVPQQDIAVSALRGLRAQAVAPEVEHRRQEVQLPSPSLKPTKKIK